MSLAAAPADSGAFSGRDLCSFRGRERLQREPRVSRGWRADERLPGCLREVQRVRVPGVELAQVAARALGPEVLLGAVDHPAQLVGDLRRGGVAVPLAEKALE